MKGCGLAGGGKASYKQVNVLLVLDGFEGTSYKRVHKVRFLEGALISCKLVTQDYTRIYTRSKSMKTALIVIAVCEVIRALQNALQIWLVVRDTGKRDNAYSEFVKSLHGTDKEFVKRMLEEFEEQEHEK